MKKTLRIFPPLPPLRLRVSALNSDRPSTGRFGRLKAQSLSRGLPMGLPRGSGPWGSKARRNSYEKKRRAPARRSRNQKSFETQSPQSRKGPEGFMRNARKQERTSSLNLFSCLPVFLIQSLLRFGRLKIYAERNEIKG